MWLNQFCFVLCILPALTLGVPHLSYWFALPSNAGPVQISLTSSAAWCPVLLPLLWVRASLQSHVILCQGTQHLGDFCKAESPFSLSRLPLNLHLLSASSTLGVAGGLAQFPHPAQLTQLWPPVSSLQDPELQCPGPLQEPILWHLQFAQVAPGHSLPLRILVPSPGQPGKHIYLALWPLV